MKKARVKKPMTPNRDVALADIADYIDTFYNRTRRHSILAVSAPSRSRRLTSLVEILRLRRRVNRLSTKVW